MSPNKSEQPSANELVPTSGEFPRPVVPEFVVGEYYYGHQPTKPVVMRSHLLMLQRQRWVIISTFLLLMGAGLLWLFSRPQMYRATAQVLVTPTERGGMAGSGNLAAEIGTMTRVRSVSTEIKLLRSPDLLDRAFARVPEELRRTGFETTATQMALYPVTIENPKDTDVLDIDVIARDPKAAAAFANAIVDAHLQRRQETLQGLAEAATDHVSKQLDQCDAAYRGTLAQLARLKQGRGVTDLSSQAMTDATSLASLQSQATTAETEMVQARLKIEMLQRQLAETPQEIRSSLTVAENPLVKDIERDILRLSQERDALLQEYQPTSSEVRAVETRIAQLRTRLAQEQQKVAQTATHARNPLYDNLREQLNNARVGVRESESRLALLRNQAGNVQGRLAALPQAEEQLALLYSRKTELENTHSYLTQQLQALSLTMHAGLPSLIQVTEARQSKSPVSPNIPVSIVLLLAVSSFVAFGLALLRDQLDERIHSGETLESAVGRRVLASVPHVKNGFGGLVTDVGCPPALLESFRILRGNLLHAMPEPLPRVIMVTSARPGEGKSTTVANLAASIALGGKRVLIIDCDLRHPTVHEVYALPNEIGLSMVLDGDTEAEMAIQPTPVEHLDVMTAGPASAFPPEMLGSVELPRMLDELREVYDCILLDSPPILNLSDGVLLAAQAEGVLVVVASNRSRYPELHHALRTLEQVGAPILGLVYNRSEDAQAVRWRG